MATLDPRTLLLRPGKRIGRASFLAGVLMLVAAGLLATAILRWVGAGTAVGFWFYLAFLLLFPYMLYSVYGQRLHDIGRTVWPLTAALAASFLILIGVMLAYGGAEYFTAFSQFDRKEAIDPAVVDEIKTAYEAELANGGSRRAKTLLSAVFGALTLWLAFRPGTATDNKYGPPAT